MTRRTKLQKDPNDKNTQNDNKNKKSQITRKLKWQKDTFGKKSEWQKGLHNTN